MFIKSIELEGFKSFREKFQINGFDYAYNVIKGPGKYDIVDAICFVIGSPTVRAVRVHEFIYGKGQRGIGKASVSITFDNTTVSQRPYGYDSAEITVKRVVLINGMDQYMINNEVVSGSRVERLFDASRIYARRPSFLITEEKMANMLTMTPFEIMSLFDTPEGFSAINDVKSRLMQRNERLEELNDMIDEQILPRMQRFEHQCDQYEQYRKVVRKLKKRTKYHVGWLYLNKLEKRRVANDGVYEAEKAYKAYNRNMRMLQDKLGEVESEIARIRSYTAAYSGSPTEEQVPEGAVEEVEVVEVVEVVERSNYEHLINGMEPDVAELMRRTLKHDAEMLENDKRMDTEGDIVLPPETVAALETRLYSTTAEMDAAGESLARLQIELKELRAKVARAPQQPGPIAASRQVDIAATADAEKLLEACIERYKFARMDSYSKLQCLTKIKKLITDSIRTVQLQLDEVTPTFKERIADADARTDEYVRLIKDHPWIAHESANIGCISGPYNYTEEEHFEEDPVLQQLTEQKNMLELGLNINAPELLVDMAEQFENAHQDLTEDAKKRALLAMELDTLEMIKMDTLETTYQQINAVFSFIFCILHPGCMARLQVPNGDTILEGVKVEAGLDGIWRESLDELTDAQYWLMVLSLMLSVQLSHSTPIGILFEVDADIEDMSITTFRAVIHNYFKQSQMIVIPQKDENFRDSNVTFQLSFVDGTPSVVRTIR